MRLAKIDYPDEREKFLARKGKSKHTARAYRTALDRLDEWCARHGIETLEMDYAAADDWIESMLAQGRSAPSVRITVSAASALWNWLDRRHQKEALRNPFRGTRVKPKNRRVKKFEVQRKRKSPSS